MNAKRHLAGLDITDQETANKIVRGQYTRRLGQRARPETVNTALEELQRWHKPKKQLGPVH